MTTYLNVKFFALSESRVKKGGGSHLKMRNNCDHFNLEVSFFFKLMLFDFFQAIQSLYETFFIIIYFQI